MIKISMNVEVDGVFRGGSLEGLGIPVGIREIPGTTPSRIPETQDLRLIVRHDSEFVLSCMCKLLVYF